MEKLIKVYICECGKEYTNPQAFNGHKSNCKIHLAALGKDITKSSLYNPESQAKAHATLAKRYAEKQERQKAKWLEEQHTCERCGKVMTELFGTGRFCSRACANKHSHSDETKAKLAIAAKTNAAVRAQTKPEITRVAIVDRVPKSILELSKRTVSKVIARMSLPCSCCGIYVPGIIWDIHHIKPKAKGGTDEMSNLTYICPNCHRICHTNPELLIKDLVSLDKFLETQDKKWQDYYFAKVK